jgi:hypothetical protein
MTWREEAKELGVPLYDHKLKRIRKKIDVLRDIEMKKIDAPSEPENVILEVREANKICRQALLNYVTEMGFKDVSIEGCIETSIRKGRFLNCKRRGIVFRGMKDGNETDNSRTDKTETGESEGTSPDVSGSVRESERESSPEGTE